MIRLLFLAVTVFLICASLFGSPWLLSQLPRAWDIHPLYLQLAIFCLLGVLFVWLLRLAIKRPRTIILKRNQAGKVWIDGIPILIRLVRIKNEMFLTAWKHPPIVVQLQITEFKLERQNTYLADSHGDYAIFPSREEIAADRVRGNGSLRAMAPALLRIKVTAKAVGSKHIRFEAS